MLVVEAESLQFGTYTFSKKPNLWEDFIYETKPNYSAMEQFLCCKKIVRVIANKV